MFNGNTTSTPLTLLCAFLAFAMVACGDDSSIGTDSGAPDAVSETGPPGSETGPPDSGSGPAVRVMPEFEVPAHSGWGWGEPSVVACPLWDVGDMTHGDIQ